MDDSVMDIDDHISDAMNSEDEPGTKAIIAPKKKDKSASETYQKVRPY